MNSAQKMIKYFAILLAASLTIGIIATVVNVGLGVVGAFVSVGNRNYENGSRGKDKVIQEDEEDDKEPGENEYDSVDNLDIESSGYKVIIKTKDGIDYVQVKTSNVSSSYEINYKKDSKTLCFENDDWIEGVFKTKGRTSKGKIYIYIPEKKQLDKVNIEMGVGTVEIEDISLRDFHIECGVGKLLCENITAESAEVEGAVGNIDLREVEFHDFQLEGGLGEISVQGKLKGKSVISAGMGNIDVNIDGDKDEYSYDVETGLGPVFIDGEKTGETKSNNNSRSNLLSVEGGIGSIHVNFR